MTLCLTKMRTSGMVEVWIRENMESLQRGVHSSCRTRTRPPYHLPSQPHGAASDTSGLSVQLNCAMVKSGNGLRRQRVGDTGVASRHHQFCQTSYRRSRDTLSAGCVNKDSTYPKGFQVFLLGISARSSNASGKAYPCASTSLMCMPYQESKRSVSEKVWYTACGARHCLREMPIHARHVETGAERSTRSCLRPTMYDPMQSSQSCGSAFQTGGRYVANVI